MENIFIYMLLVAASSTLCATTTRAINVEHVLNSINDSVFASSISFNESGSDDQYQLSINKKSLEDNVIAIVESGKIEGVKLVLNFHYYNRLTRAECTKGKVTTICDGVQLHIKTNIAFFFRERTYVYEIIPN